MSEASDGIGGMAGRAARGAAWTIVFGLLARGIGVAGTLVMTHLIEPDVYMAVVLMVMGTTVIAPPWLAWQLKRVFKREGVTPKPLAPEPEHNEREEEGAASPEPRAEGETTAH